MAAPQPTSQQQQQQQPSPHLWAFFGAGEPPPFAPAPADAAARDRILLLAHYAMQSGPTFIETVRSKQGGNPEYAFLAPGGADSAFYRWALWAAGCGLPVDQPPPAACPAPQLQYVAATAVPMQQQHAAPLYAQQQAVPQGYAQPPSQYQQPAQQPPPQYQQPAQQPPPQYQQPAQQPPPQYQQEQPQQQLPQLPPEVASGFSQVLDALTGSKESIKASQGWFMACWPYAQGMAHEMALRAASPGQQFDQLLHLVYLANDICFRAAQKQQQPAADGQPQQPNADAAAVCGAFAPALGAMLAAAHTAAADDDGRAKLARMLSFWQDKGVFDGATVARLQGEMASGDAAAVLRANYAPQQQQQQQPQQPQQPQQQVLQPQQPQAARGWGPPAAAPAAAAAAGPAVYAALPPVAPGGLDPAAQPQHAAAVAPGWGHAAQPQQPAAVPPGGSGWGMPTQPQLGPAVAVAPSGSTRWGQPQPQPAGAPHSGWGPPQDPHQQHAAPSLQAASGWGPPQQPQQQMAALVAAPQAHAAWAQGAPVAAVPAASAPAAPWSAGYAAQQAPTQPPADGALTAQQHHHHHQQPAPGALPHLQPPAQQQHPAAAAQQPEPQAPAPQPASSFNFPPGLIPQLVRDKSKYSEPYAPMDPEEVDRLGLPPPPERDAYLKSRLDKLLMELKEHKPGTSRADLEEARSAARAQQGLEPDSDEELALGSTGSRLARRKALGLGVGGVQERRRQRTMRVAGGMADDGSYVGPGGGRGERLGLGAHARSASAAAATEADLGDVYSSYRRMRSDSYHEMIHSGAGVSNMARGGGR